MARRWYVVYDERRRSDGDISSDEVEHFGSFSKVLSHAAERSLATRRNFYIARCVRDRRASRAHREAGLDEKCVPVATVTVTRSGKKR